ncbi:MAG: TAXI family TRAP transporter solute-binding subunit, partial [Aestuariivirga sp.]
MKNAFAMFVAVFLAFALSTVVQSEDLRSQKLNQSTIGLLASTPELSGNVLDIADAMDHTDGLRILPIIGRGSLQSINDLLFLRGVDVALLSSDSLAFVKKHDLYKEETGKIAYMAKLANLNVIVLARKDIAGIENLTGLRVATGPANSDEFVAAELIFDAIGMPYERVPTTGKNSVAALLDGRIDAAVFTGAASVQLLNAIKAKSGLHILPLSLPESLADTYSPAILDSKEFPNLIPDG